jgi:hypothetical protein
MKRTVCVLLTIVYILIDDSIICIYISYIQRRYSMSRVKALQYLTAIKKSQEHKL